jgi:SAM-dependent methyltransferase
VSIARLEEHRRLWDAKPVLAAVYEPWFEAVLQPLPPGSRVLEVGAGPGFMAEFARLRRPDLRWLASDLHPAAWNDLAADASLLPLRSGALGAVVGLDVLHHLAEPARFFREAGRVLDTGGRLTLVEPWITAFSYGIYRWLHQEHCRLRVDPWKPFAGSGKDSFEGDAAVPWKMVRDTPVRRWEELGFGPPHVDRRNAFAYLLSLGFRRPSLLPRRLARPLRALDGWTAPLARATALRAVVAWERRAAI